MRFFNFKKKINFKKRILFSILFTAGFVALFNNIWLVKLAKHHYSFKFDIFFIVLVLSFLISFKLSNYLAKFKEIKNNSRIDIAFLSIFFILLFLPMSRIDNYSTKAKNENRLLETYKPLINKNGSLNYNFGNDFEKFFNDRFFLRSFLISNYHFIKMLCAYKYYDTGSIVFFKDNNYVFDKKLLPRADDFPKDKVIKTAKALDRFQDWCDKNNIKLYLLVVPYNMHIYQDDIKPLDNPKGLIALNGNVNEFIKNTKTKVIYPFDKLKEGSKKERTFFKTDHHWTDYGAFIGYQELMKEIKKDYPKIRVLGENDFDYHYSKKVRKGLDRKFGAGNQLNRAGAFLLPLRSKILDEEYRYFEYKDKASIVRKQFDNTHRLGEKSFYSKGTDLRVVEIGNSMNNNLLPYIEASFKNVNYFYLNDIKDRKDEEKYKIMKYYKKDILDFKPDIIVLCLTNRVIKRIDEFFLEEEN